MKRWQWVVLITAAAASIVLAYIGDPEHFPAFYAAFGFGGALLFIGLAKLILKKVLMRKEDYYDES